MRSSKILLVDALINLILGGLSAAFPKSTVKLGVPHTDTTFGSGLNIDLGTSLRATLPSPTPTPIETMAAASKKTMGTKKQSPQAPPLPGGPSGLGSGRIGRPADTGRPS